MAFGLGAFLSLISGSSTNLKGRKLIQNEHWQCALIIAHVIYSDEHSANEVLPTAFSK